MSGTMKLEIEIPLSSILSVLINGMDNRASNYWCRIGEAKVPATFKHEDHPWLDPQLSRCYFAALIEGGELEVFEIDEDDPSEPIARYVLDLAALRRGLLLMAAKHAWLFADLVSGDDDIWTADCLLQLSLLGELRYG